MGFTPHIIGPTMLDWDEMCDTLLGIIPVKGESIVNSMIKLKWLRDNLLPIDENSSIEVIHAHARAYILGLIIGVLMPDETGNKVHLMYLNYLTNLRRTKRYSWSSACLVVLYREMCREIDGRARTVSGCALLLQSWAWFQMPFIAPISRVSPTFPLVCQWSGGRVLNYKNVPHNDLVGYRAMIDHMQQNQVTFTISILINGCK